jgi:hypothetical protein
MEIMDVRPARVSAGLVAIGDMLVTSPVGADGPRPSTWIGAVTEHIIVTERPDEDGQMTAVAEDEAKNWRQWRIGLVSGENKESAVIPADGWVWVHLPVVAG